MRPENGSGKFWGVKGFIPSFTLMVASQELESGPPPGMSAGGKSPPPGLSSALHRCSPGQSCSRGVSESLLPALCQPPPASIARVQWASRPGSGEDPGRGTPIFSTVALALMFCLEGIGGFARKRALTPSPLIYSLSPLPWLLLKDVNPSRCLTLWVVLFQMPVSPYLLC